MLKSNDTLVQASVNDRGPIEMSADVPRGMARRTFMPCYRAGGNTCYADTPTAINREHCLFEANRCVFVCGG